LAAAPPPPAKVQLVVKNLDNDTILNWTDGPGAPAGTRYEVVWRPLGAPNWERSVAVPLKPNEGLNGAPDHAITLQISKDNVIFGVRAVDGAGHRSLAVVPMPER
jgi:hypothetical protein